VTAGTAVDVTVSAASGRNFALSPGGTLGTVRDAGTNAPGQVVAAYLADGTSSKPRRPPTGCVIGDSRRYLYVHASVVGIFYLDELQRAAVLARARSATERPSW
jgi:hypothetical protein